MKQPPATQTNEVRHTIIASKDLTDDVALDIFADYMEKDRDKLLDYMNAFSAISVLAKAAKEGVITYDTAGGMLRNVGTLSEIFYVLYK